MVALVSTDPPASPESVAQPFHGWGFRRRPVPGGYVEETGVTGLVRYGTEVADEWHHALRLSRAARVYREMGDNDSNVGASLHLIDANVRRVGWRADPADHAQGEDAARLISEVFDDMEHSWVDLVSEIFSMVQFGWSAFEKVYKYRVGPDEADKTRRSKFTDGKVGVRKVEIRAQETLDGWEFDEDSDLRGMWQRASPNYNRVLIPIEKMILFRPKQSKGNPEGRSLLRPAFRSWFFLKRLEELEAIGIERDAIGLIFMQLPTSYFDASASTAKKQAILDWAKQVSQVRRNEHEGLVIPSEVLPDGKPSGFKLGVVQGEGKRQIDVGAAITRHRQSIGQALLTQFIFMGMDKIGTQALSTSIIDVFMTSLAVLLDVVEELVNRELVAEIMKINGYPREAWPRWKHADVQKADVRPLAEALVKLVDAGVLTPDDKLEEFVRLEARLPEKDEEDDPDDPDKDVPPEGGLPRGEDGSNKEAASTIVQLTTAIDRLAKIGDVELCNAARNALAMVLGLPNPAPLDQAHLDAMNKKPDPLDGDDDQGEDPPRGKPKKTKPTPPR